MNILQFILTCSIVTFIVGGGWFIHGVWVDRISQHAKWSELNRTDLIAAIAAAQIIVVVPILITIGALKG